MRTLPQRWLARARDGYDNVRYRSLRFSALPTELVAWRAGRKEIGAYRVLTENELRATRKSDTVFVFGSGASLNALTDSEWRVIAESDTLGFNWFVRQRFVRCDYHLIRELVAHDRQPELWRPELERYGELLRSNPNYAQTIFLVQSGLRATNGNRAIGLRLLPSGSRVFRWRTRLFRLDLSESFRDGLTHGYGALGETVNFAYLLGWKRIVLTGVDLYDRRYFWLDADEQRPVDVERGFGPDEPHGTGTNLTVELFRNWGRALAAEGVELLVQNPRSLLAEVLPVYRVGGGDPDGSG